MARPSNNSPTYTTCGLYKCLLQFKYVKINLARVGSVVNNSVVEKGVAAIYDQERLRLSVVL